MKNKEYEQGISEEGSQKANKNMKEILKLISDKNSN